MFKPFYTLIFLLTVGVIMALMALIFPEKGISISNDINLSFVSLTDFFEEDTVETINVDELLQSYEEPFDSASFKDSIKVYEWNVRQQKLRIQYAEGNSQKLNKLFNYLYNYKKGSSKVRIIHYGDSQIEGDRISSYFRDKLQKEYGGYGPGYVPAKTVVPSMSIKQSQSENWLRYTVFGKKDTTVHHKNYGIYGIFSRFTPYNDDDLSDTVNAWIELEPSHLGYGKTRTYKTLEMLYGNVQEPFRLVIKNEDSVFVDTLLKADGVANHFTLRFKSTPKKLRLEFESTISPDIYGLRLENSTGVSVDNVAMRGSSGTVFKKIDRLQLSRQFTQAKPKLLLLQYGGNTVPYIKSKKDAENYGRWFKGQINYLKSLNPNCDIIVIGPSDMATKVKTEFVTYPFLEAVRDELKKATLEAGCGFWDIYEVMGGANSMASWVNTDPPLAGKDYVHFTPRGAKHIAELFYDAIEKDFEDYKNIQEEIKRKEEEVKRAEEELKKMKAQKDSLTQDTVANEV